MIEPWFLQLHPLHFLASAVWLQLTGSDACFSHVGEAEACSIWWTGKVWVSARFILDLSLNTDFEWQHPEGVTKVPCSPRCRHLHLYRCSIPVLLYSSARKDWLFWGFCVLLLTKGQRETKRWTVLRIPLICSGSLECYNLFLCFFHQLGSVGNCSVRGGWVLSWLQSGQGASPGTHLHIWQQPIMHNWVQGDVGLGLARVPCRTICALCPTFSVWIVD